MGKKTRVLVFPAGEVNAVELHDALSTNVNIEVIGASSVERHGSYVFRRYFGGLPMISDASFLAAFNSLLEQERIDFVFPTHDTVALFFAEHRAEIRARVLTAEAETARICRDKKKTYALFADEDFCPVVYPEIERASFPCFIKPRTKQGAVGARILRQAKDIPQEICWDDFVITEYLTGAELTVDCLTDQHGKLRAVLPRSRDRVCAGISVAGAALEATKDVIYIAETLNRALNFFGLWYFQLKRDAADHWKLLEISARCAGSMCLSRARGVNLPLLSVYAAMGRELEIIENPYAVKMDRTLISRYRLDYEYDTVYVDYDDTIIVNQQVCLPVIRFLYQCRNQGKKLVLLSRHRMETGESVGASLRKYAIAESLFHHIVEIGPDEEKSAYISDQAAIFIDNAYSERKKVRHVHHIPAFDVDGIEALIDWRV